MNVVIFGATGMVGQGVLRESLADPDVARVLVIGRATGLADLKLREYVVPALTELGPAASDLATVDACFFCVGVSSLGMSEAQYTDVTYDLTLAVAGELARQRPAMTFVYVSGMGTDSSERGRVMWARVKGRTENALLRLPFRGTYLFRPGVIIPGPGIRSRTTWYRLLYLVVAPAGPALMRLFPGAVTTSAQIGRAMLAVARRGYPRPVLEPHDINAC